MRTFRILISCSLRTILINPQYLCPQSNPFPVDCGLKCSVLFSLFSRCATCFAHLILRDLLVLITPFFFFGATAPPWSRASSFTRFLYHTVGLLWTCDLITFGRAKVWFTYHFISSPICADVLNVVCERLKSALFALRLETVSWQYRRICTCFYHITTFCVPWNKGINVKNKIITQLLI